MLRTNKVSIVTVLILALFASSGDVSAQEKKQQDKKPKVVIPVFLLNSPVLESAAVQDPFFGSMGAESLKDLVGRLEKARDDDDVEAVILLMGNASMGTGQLEEICQAIRQLRDSGKPVYAHADSLRFGQLALVSSASRVSVAPVGELFITGMYGSQPHLRGLLDKMHVTPDFITCGEYKSAGEMFMRSEPSPEARRMYDWLFDGIYDSYVGLIAEGRGKNCEEVRRWIDRGLYSAEKATNVGIIDCAETRADFLKHIEKQHGNDAELDKKYGKGKSKSLDLSSPFAVFRIWADLLGGKPKRSQKDTVAIVYVDGAIVPGKPQPSPFGSQGMAYSDPIRKALDKAAEDESIKAVVLRVNSPGGSAVASEIILQATKRVAAKKPFVVSMGNIAGSGGYYVACGTDTIFADSATITASIGVVGGKLATNKMWESVGIHWHPIERGKNAGMLYSGDVFTDEQRQNLQSWMDEVYEVFKGHVVEARGNRLTQPIEKLAGGRVFTGRQALERGLVDRLGTLSDAIRFAANEADLEEYEVRVVPRPKSIIELMLSDLFDKEEDDGHIGLRARVGQLQTTSYLWEAAAPLLNRLAPQKSESLRQALRQLDVLHGESLSLTTPVIVIE